MLSPVEDDRCHGVEHFFGGVRIEQLFPDDSLALWKIHGKHPEMSRRCIGQQDGYNITLHDFADVRGYDAKQLAKLEV